MQSDADFSSPHLRVHQRLATSGARTALPFEVDGGLFLAVPQLSEDVPDQPAHMNGGNSDLDMPIFRWVDGRFVEDQRIPTAGGEDVTVFTIAGRTFMATASMRTGHGPYQMNTTSQVHERVGGAWVPFQSFDTFCAKQWVAFTVGGRHFLGLAQGVTLPHATPTVPRESRIFEWTGERFDEFQVLEGGWGYNFHAFDCGGHRFLGYADHSSASLLYRWTGAAFEPFQTIAERSGRAFRYFEQDGQCWLAFATVDSNSVLYRWTGTAFDAHQTLGVPCAREFELIRRGDALYLVRMRFIEGTPADPKTDLLSDLWKWTGDGFDLVEHFPTYGGTDATLFEADGKSYLAVSNSLSPDIRFRQDMVIYGLAL